MVLEDLAGLLVSTHCTASFPVPRPTLLGIAHDSRPGSVGRGGGGGGDKMRKKGDERRGRGRWEEERYKKIKEEKIG